MEKEKSVVKHVTEEDFHHLESLENACGALSNIASVFYESRDIKDHIQAQNPYDEDEVVDLGEHPTFALVLEGWVGGVANELMQAGYTQEVKAIAKRHRIGLTFINQDE